jgi:hypothetical protein
VKRTRKRRRGEGESSFAPPFVPPAKNPDRAVPMEKEKREKKSKEKLIYADLLGVSSMDSEMD